MNRSLRTGVAAAKRSILWAPLTLGARLVLADALKPHFTPDKLERVQSASKRGAFAGPGAFEEPMKRPSLSSVLLLGVAAWRRNQPRL